MENAVSAEYTKLHAKARIMHHLEVPYALAKIKADGATHEIAGLRMGGDPTTWYALHFYDAFGDFQLVG